METINRRPSPALAILAMGILAALGVFLAMETNTHALTRHGPQAFTVAAAFSPDGKCNLGPSVLLQAAQGRKLYVCFENINRVDLHVTEANGDPVTDIPADQISKPVKYLRSVLGRDTYATVKIWGQVPAWFLELLP